MRTFFALAVLSCILSSCWRAPAEGRLACGPAGECPTGWYCHSTNLCWSTPESGFDGGLDGATDAGIDAPRPDVPDRDVPILDAPVDAPAIPDRCGNATVDDPTWSPLAGAFAGMEVVSLPELDLGVHLQPEYNGPRVTPVLSLATAAAHALLVHTRGLPGNPSEARFVNVDLSSWGRYREVPLDFGFPVITVGVGARDASTMGFGLRASGFAGSAISGFAFTYGGVAASITAETISAGDPPNVPRRGTAVLGGSRADGISMPVEYVARETLASDGAPVVGAVDMGRSLGSYRSSLTTSGPTAPDLFIDGTVSNVVLLQADAPGLELALWNTRNTPLFTEVPARTNDVNTLSLARAPSGIASMEWMDGVQHLLAVPHTLSGGGSVVDLYRASCPGAMPCTLESAPLVTLDPHQPEHVIEQVVLVRLPTTWAILTLERLGESALVYLRILGLDLMEVPETAAVLAAPLLPARTASAVRIAASASRTPTATTLLVAASYDSVDSATSQIVVTGLRGCAMP